MRLGNNPVRCALALGVAASLTACMANHTTIDSVLAQHRRSITHPRPIDRAIAAAAAAAEATCGGPVALNVDGDPADYGSDPSDYECLPR